MLRHLLLAVSLSVTCALQVAAQAGASPSATTAPPTNSSPRSSSTITATSTSSEPPDVYLNVPTLSVGRIELDVEDLSADINLNARVASIVTLNAGVNVAIRKVNLTITDVGKYSEMPYYVLEDAELELVVRLGHLVDIVGRVFDSLDLNPLLINAVNNVTSLLDDVVGEVDGLLGSITQGGTTLSFVVDNLGNIVQEVNGVSTIVGDYSQNMTYTGESQNLGNGLTKKTYSYSPLNALVDIIFNSAGQIVQAVTQKKAGSGSSSSSTASAATGTGSVASTGT
ncbi:hypothetical protein PRZ48_010576 [Zasmidium cellare]|uniref:Uncharacterized protein n=1 Tax=Zasmidium cellare TaxID=395010 RepID=A0ABR0E9N0_ZASCE|nr:hypothetical protein PRZ48_010576 [Zasmidium cellare]